jgi:hypothetical protein
VRPIAVAEKEARWEQEHVDDGVLVVREAELRSKRDGAQYLRLLLGDRTGCVPSNVWEDVAAASAIAAMGTPVHVSGCLRVSARYGAELKLRSPGPPSPERSTSRTCRTARSARRR